jgi:hypothetical protein
VHALARGQGAREAMEQALHVFSQLETWMQFDSADDHRWLPPKTVEKPTTRGRAASPEISPAIGKRPSFVA